MIDGRLAVDGEPAMIESLRSSLGRLAKRKGAIRYYREEGEAEAPIEAVEVMKAMIEHRLPIRLSSRPDYSDAIGAHGNPIAGESRPPDMCKLSRDRWSWLKWLIIILFPIPFGPWWLTVICLTVFCVMAWLLESFTTKA